MSEEATHQLLEDSEHSLAVNQKCFTEGALHVIHDWSIRHLHQAGQDQGL